jgi:hypothetical protein
MKNILCCTVLILLVLLVSIECKLQSLVAFEYKDRYAYFLKFDPNEIHWNVTQTVGSPNKLYGASSVVTKSTYFTLTQGAIETFDLQSMQINGNMLVSMKNYYADYKMFYDEELDIFIISDSKDDHSIMIFSSKTGLSFVLKPIPTLSHIAYDSKSKRIFYYSKDSIVIMDLKGNLLNIIPCKTEQLVSDPIYNEFTGALIGSYRGQIKSTIYYVTGLRKDSYNPLILDIGNFGLKGIQLRTIDKQNNVLYVQNDRMLYGISLNTKEIISSFSIQDKVYLQDFQVIPD